MVLVVSYYLFSENFLNLTLLKILFSIIFLIFTDRSIAEWLQTVVWLLHFKCRTSSFTQKIFFWVSQKFFPQVPIIFPDTPKSFGQKDF